MSKFTVTTKINHDSLWTKATFADKSWVKFSITRSGICVRAKNVDDTTFRELDAVVTVVYKEWKRRRDLSVFSKLTYGDLASDVAKAWSKMSEEA